MLRSYVEPIGAGALFFLAVVLVAWIPYAIWQYRQRGRVRKRRALVDALFGLYLACAWALILYPFPVSQATACASNVSPIVIPFAWVSRMNASLPTGTERSWQAIVENPVLLGVIFNIALTIPFGVFLRRWFQRSLITTTLLGLGLSLAFELTQLTGIWGLYQCPYRTFEVDDLIANTLGAGVGWLVAPMIHLLPLRRKTDDEPVKTEHASLFRRFSAFSIDLPFWVLTYATFYFVSSTVLAIAASQPIDQTPLALACAFSSFAVVFIAIPAYANGATIGQSLLRLRTTRADGTGAPATVRQFVVRTVVLWSPPSLLMLLATTLTEDWFVFMILVAVIAVTWWLCLAISDWRRPDRRCLHDLAAGTEVVVEPASTAPTSST